MHSYDSTSRRLGQEGCESKANRTVTHAFRYFLLEITVLRKKPDDSADNMILTLLDTMKYKCV